MYIYCNLKSSLFYQGSGILDKKIFATGRGIEQGWEEAKSLGNTLSWFNSLTANLKSFPYKVLLK